MSFGSFTLHIGPMYSGKSFELIRALDRAGYARQRAVALKPGCDTRSLNYIAARRADPYAPGNFLIHAQYPAQGCDSQEEFKRIIAEGKPHVLVIDELQFFDTWIVDELFELRAHNALMHIVAAGLDTDYRREPFPVISGLIALADTVRKETAICFTCGGIAQFSRRISGGTERIELDTLQNSPYEAACASCHTLPEH